jgi:hypothetical protein
LRLLLCAPPGASGAEPLVAAAIEDAADGTDVRVLLSDRGLGWLEGDWCKRLAEAGVRVAICAKSAREKRLDATAVPPTVAWSSLSSFAANAPANSRVWSAIA